MLNRNHIKTKFNKEFAITRKSVMRNLSLNLYDKLEIELLSKFTSGKLKLSLKTAAKRDVTMETLWLLIELISLDSEEQCDVLDSLAKNL